MSKAIPGPWKAVQCPVSKKWIVEVRHSGYKAFVADVAADYPNHPGGEAFQGDSEGTAALIASAPDLRDALATLVRLITAGVSTTTMLETEMAGAGALVNARAVLRKASPVDTE